ncbi:MAG: NAD(P)/FAD-dependent oxidoreductase [Phycisphaerales bacterium]
MTSPTPPQHVDLAVIGAGAAGLMAAISAGREAQRLNARLTIVALDGARTLGAKILVAGGGRCNVTHHQVDDSAYAGSTRPAIRKVLKRFDVPDTIRFFRELGVELKKEDTGKLFPVTDSARDVLNALLRAARDADVKVIHPWRVADVQPDPDGFLVTRDDEAEGPSAFRARRVILATGGLSLPKSGSDGQGLNIARALHVEVTPRLFPALVPLTLPRDHFLCALSGITIPAAITVRTGTNKKIVSFTNSTLLTHFGLSGPGVLDASRYYLDARAQDPEVGLEIHFLPFHSSEWLDEQLRSAGKATPTTILREHMPERLARALAGNDANTPCAALTKDARRAIVTACTALRLPITGNRGYLFAEVTAGGVPLSALRLESMESRAQPGLHLVGEICDVDGRIGGFNFQWAWASGFVAGSAAAAALAGC